MEKKKGTGPYNAIEGHFFFAFLGDFTGSVTAWINAVLAVGNSIMNATFSGRAWHRLGV
jgi:hypothetical protein